MGDIASLVVVYGVAGVGLSAAVIMAVAAYMHHRRRSRVAAYVRSVDAAIREGFALIRGTVIAGEDAETAQDPVISVDVPVPGSSAPPRATAHAFPIQLPSGAVLRVEPEEGMISLDTTFALTSRGLGLVYVTEIRRGQEIYLSGMVRREIDPRATGKGYRDAARAWVVRAPSQGQLCISSEAVIAQHADRARFHGGWALALGAGLVALQAGLFSSFHARVFGQLAGKIEIGTVEGILALVLSGAAVFAYHKAAELTAPWEEHAIARK